MSTARILIRLALAAFILFLAPAAIPAPIQVSLPALQSSPAIAVDSTGQHIVIAFQDFRGFALTPNRVAGWVYSDNGGSSFADGGQMPSDVTQTLQVFGHPDVKYDATRSSFFYATIVYDGNFQMVGLYQSTDNGHSWASPITVTPSRVVNNFADAAFLDVDPHTGRILVTWTNFTPTGGTEVKSSFSDNAGTTWSPAATIDSLGTGLGSVTDLVPRFAGDGLSNATSTVGYAWLSTDGTGQNSIRFARATSNGGTTGLPVDVSPSAFATIDDILGCDRARSSPSLAIGPNGNIYVGYTTFKPDGGDFVMQRSTDGGVTFGQPVIVNSHPGSDRAQWCPFVTVDRSSGRVYAQYYDQGIATAGDLIEVFYCPSDDGGATFKKPQPLTDRPFHGGYGNDTSQPNLGDYMGAVAQNGELFSVWGGTSPAGFTSGQPATSMTVPDIFFVRTPASQSKPSLRLGAYSVVETGPAPLGGNGFIDPNEQITLTIPLENYVTNSTSAATVTGISAVLSTSTPGVTVTTSTATYADIIAGSSVPPSVSLVAQLAPMFVPGTAIDFTLNVTTTQGTISLPFNLATGTPNATTIFSENFDGVAPGSLPTGWINVHFGSSGVVPWTTSNSFRGVLTTNAAFHTGDVVSIGDIRTERLVSPSFSVPANAEYVTLELDTAYYTKDEPSLTVKAYDGLLLRLLEQTPGRTQRPVAIEAFAQEFMTGSSPFYPKHLTRSNSPFYVGDFSAWAGDSNGMKHVKMKLPGTAGSTVRLWFEYSQLFGCTSGTGPCGVAFDNVLAQSVVSMHPTTTILTASSPNPITRGQSVMLTASVSTANGPLSEGTVVFKEGATVLAGPNALLAGSTSFTTSALLFGSHDITAEYTSTSGDNAPSSALLTVVVGTAPTGLVATATTATNVDLSWYAVTGATQYEIVRAPSSIPFTVVTATSYSDGSVSGLTTYVYQVRATDSPGHSTPFSAPDAATTFFFTDDPLVPNVSLIKANYSMEVRQAIDLFRTAGGLGTYPFGADLTGLLVRAADVEAMLTALNEGRTTLGLSTITFSVPPVAGSTRVTPSQLQQLRDGVK